MIEDFLSLFQTEFYIKVGRILFATWPIWLPFILVSLCVNTWFAYKRREWIKSQGSVLLEIKLPRDIQRSPEAMEFVLNGIWEGAAGSVTDVFLSGRVRDWFSLEIVSIGGEVKFFIWALPKWKGIIESRIYAEYPGAEVFETKDYSLNVIYDPSKIKVWGITTSLVKPDAYPIKTYIDYELDKTGKEAEEITDPIMPVIEYLGSLKPGEQAWIQIMIQAHRKEGFTTDAQIFGKPDWSKGIKNEVKKIIEEEVIVKSGDSGKITDLTDAQKNAIISMERNAGKLAFDSMVRIVYTAPLEVFDKVKGMGIIGSMRQFGSRNLNGIKPNWFSGGGTYPWDDFRDRNKREGDKTLLDAYKRRSFFNVPYRHLNGKPYVLTTEELATLFHFPGASVTTPTLTRIPSKKAEAPSNLPV